MIDENDIRKYETNVKHEYGVCIDADGDLAISIRVQRDGRMAESYIVKVKELHPDYLDGVKFERICMVAAAKWQPLDKMLHMPCQS